MQRGYWRHFPPDARLPVGRIITPRGNFRGNSVENAGCGMGPIRALPQPLSLIGNAEYALVELPSARLCRSQPWTKR